MMTNPRLTVEEALALTEQRRKQWCLLGIDRVTGHKTYACSRCYRFRFTRVTEAPPPNHCPKCGHVQELES